MAVPWDGPAYVRMFPPAPAEPVGAGVLAPDARGILDRLTIVVRIEGEPLAAVLDRVRAEGGEVALEPIPISTSGLYARFFDPDGNSFGLWQDRDPSDGSSGFERSVRCVGGECRPVIDMLARPLSCSSVSICLASD